MKTWVWALVWLLSAAASQAAEPYAQSIPSKRVAVMDLKVSGEYSEQVKDWLPALIEKYRN